MTPADLQRGMPNFASIDVSFISLRIIFPVLKTLLVPGSNIVALVKPQFEAGREQVGKKGIVRDPSVHESVLDKMIEFSSGIGYTIVNLSFSPITGGDGNIEFLLHLRWDGEDATTGEILLSQTPAQVVAEAHRELKKKKTTEE
jgi:23S rRNA (cytidine1920-2'-O)/16S rRNA (cytidine1409-2'-O)-methyltransferase